MQIAVEGWSETEQQHEELGNADTMKKTENTQGREQKEAHLGIRVSRVNAIRFSQRFTEAKERGNSARRKKKD